MAYIVTADITERIGTILTARKTAASGDTPDADVLEEIRGGAEAFVNSFLAKRYQVPIVVSGDATLAALLKSRTLDIAVYNTHLRKPPVPTDIETAYNATVTWLKDIAAGRAELPAVTNELPAPTTSGPVGEVSGVEPVFGRSNMAGF